MATYEADIIPQRGNVIDGDVKRIYLITLTRYDTPTSKGAKAGARTVRAWSKAGAERRARHLISDMVNADQARRTVAITARIRRIEQAQSPIPRRNLSRE